MQKSFFMLHTIALFCVVLTLSFSPSSIKSVNASGEGIVVPGALTVLTNSTDVPLSDDFDITGSGNVMVFVELDSGSTSTISIGTNTGLTLESGVTGWTNQRAIYFHGNVADSNAALDSLTITTSSPEATNLTITVTEYDSNYAYLPATGHFYRQITASGIDFGPALADAAAQTYKSRPGYIATITSATEYNFTKSLIYSTNSVWIALSDDVSEGSWRWKAGPESGTVTTYTRWCSGQPNGIIVDQDYVHFGGSANGSCWTDVEENDGSIDGYLIEFGDSTAFSDFFDAVMPITVANATATPTNTATPTETTTPTETATPTTTRTPAPATAEPTASATRMPTAFVTHTPVASATLSPTEFVTYTPTASATLSPTLVVDTPSILPISETPTATMIDATALLITTSDALEPATSTPQNDSLQDATMTLTAEPSMTVLASATSTSIVATLEVSTTAVIPTSEITATAVITDANESIDTLLDTEVSLELLTSKTLNTTQVKAILSALVGKKLTQTQALAVASNPVLIQQMTATQAVEVFATLDTSTLDEASKDAMINAVQDAPREIREAFEDNIDMYGDGFNSYVPLGSQIPIETRRALMATTVASAAIAASAARGRRK